MKTDRRYIHSAALGLVDSPDRLDQLRAIGDPLYALDGVMDWTIFGPVLDRIPRAVPKGPGGRPAFPPLWMFKILVVQSLYGLSDEQTQFQILDRDSFQRFLGLNKADTVPDQNTIREFREKLTKAELFGELFSAFDARLADRGFITRKGQIIDASFVEVPRQRNSQTLDTLTCKGDPETWADSAYAGANCKEILQRKGIVAHLCEKGTRGHALSKGQKRSNRAKSRKRVRVEHIFGFMTGSMNAMFQRCVGFARNKAGILLANLVYNMARTEQIIRLRLLGRKTPVLVDA